MRQTHDISRENIISTSCQLPRAGLDTKKILQNSTVAIFVVI
jgi:hypothetical protein